MREEAFRRFLAPRLGARSIDSYLSNLRRVERVLRVDVDALALDDQLIENVREQLRAASVSDAKVSDCLSALRAYAALRRETAGTYPLLPAPSTAADRSPNGLASMTTAALLASYAAILREFRACGITRTGNGPAGNYAEHLFSRALG
ncbi:hypothetical protein [Sphingomonas sp.]|uniref:hypothetical protein n=1 Tax=Sphingomonas sp. TaxID=28214 RepID=UPI0035C80959